MQQTDAEEHQFCVAAGWLGADPYQLSQPESQAIISAAEELPDAIREEVLKSAPPARLPSVTRWVKAGLEAIQNNAVSDGQWNALRDRISLPSTVGPPWQVGYQLARELRRILRLADIAFVNLDTLVNVPIPLLPAASPPAQSFDGIIGIGRGSICCYTPKSRQDSQRFLCARGLLAFLFDKS